MYFNLLFFLQNFELCETLCVFITFNEMHGFIRVYNGTKYLVLFGHMLLLKVLSIVQD